MKASAPPKPSNPTIAAVVRQQTGVPWSRARSLCTEGRVTVNGKRCLDPALRVTPEMVITVDPTARKLDTGALPRGAITTFQFRLGVAYRFGERGHLFSPAPAGPQPPLPPVAPPEPQPPSPSPYPTLAGQ